MSGMGAGLPMHYILYRFRPVNAICLAVSLRVVGLTNTQFGYLITQYGY